MNPGGAVTAIYILSSQTEEFYDYFAHVSEPMDIDTVRSNVEVLGYGSFEEFKQDCNKIHYNSIAYNGEDHEVTELAKEMIDSG